MNPNVLLIMTDQQRGDAVGCAGRPFVQTPNLDRLAARGLRFDRAYSETPVCVPARHGMLTGLYPHRLGMLDNTGRYPGRSIPTIADVMTDAGYWTQLVGKAHFRPAKRHMGFQGMLISEGVPRYRTDDDYLMYLEQQGLGDVHEPIGRRSRDYYQPQVSPVPNEHHLTTWTADRTVEFLRAFRNRPFFCFTSFFCPHPPFAPPEPWARSYEDVDIPAPVVGESDREPVDTFLLRQNRSKGIDNPDSKRIRRLQERYYASVTHVDHAVGHILDTLDELRLTEQTLVLFVSDHGELLGDHLAWGKRSFYEPAARIPFLMSWPGTLPQGEARHHLVSLCDIFPTIAEAADARRPVDLSGQSVLSVAKTADAPWRDRLFGEFGSGRAAKYMVRWGDWKYTYYVNGAKEQLFNLSSDPDELCNLAGDQPELCQAGKDALIQHFQSEKYEAALDGSGLLVLPFKPIPLGDVLNQEPAWPQRETEPEAGTSVS